jgi:hypothetical protein
MVFRPTRPKTGVGSTGMLPRKSEALPGNRIDVAPSLDRACGIGVIWPVGAPSPAGATTLAMDGEGRKHSVSKTPVITAKV